MTKDDFKVFQAYHIDYILRDKHQPYIFREMHINENHIKEPDLLIPIVIPETYTQTIECLVFRSNENKTYMYRGYLYINPKGENVKKMTLYSRNGKEVAFDPKIDDASIFTEKVKMYVDNYDNFRSIDKL